MITDWLLSPTPRFALLLLSVVNAYFAWRWLRAERLVRRQIKEMALLEFDNRGHRIQGHNLSNAIYMLSRKLGVEVPKPLLKYDIEKATRRQWESDQVGNP